jgi:hypothetical protein
MISSNPNTTNPIHHLLYYILFGALHEACHLLAAHLTSCSNDSSDLSWTNLTRSALGRSSILAVDECDGLWRESIVLHSGWIFSVLLAVALEFHKRRHRRSMKDEDVAPLSPAARAAMVTAVEAVVTDLFRWTPHHSNAFTNKILVYCGNFGIVLLNPMWLSVDGGRTALQVLEKMVEVTMMRG